jgi:tetratricopeptide (TPR) repeat protein
MRGFLRVEPRGRSALILLLLITVAYGGSLWNGFVHDDVLFMTRDPRVQSFSLLPRLFVQARWDFDQPDARPTVHHYYRPLEPLPYAVSHLFFHAAPWPSHLLHLLLHFANVLLVLAALRRLLGEESAALAGAAVFAVHPGCSEAVLWVAAEGGLGTFLCTMAIFLVHTGPHGRRWYGRLSMAVLYLFALWFKETGVLAPVFVVLWDLVAAPDRGPRRVLRSLGHYALFVPPFVLYALLRRHALGDVVPTLYVSFTRWELVLNGIAQLPEYARSFLWPFHLTLHHDFDPIHGMANAPFLEGAAILAAAALGFAATVRSRPLVAFGIAWALVAVAPYLVVHKPQDNVYAERYLYDPAFGLCLLLGCGWRRLEDRLAAVGRRRAAAGLAALLVLFLVLDVRRTGDWRDEVTLFEKTLAQSSRAEVIRVNLAVRLLHLGRYDEGIRILEELVSFNPSYRGAWHNLGDLYQAKGMSEKAIGAFEKAIRDDPFDAASLLNLGYLYDKAGRREAAVKMYLRATRVAPHGAAAWYNLALAAFDAGQLENARQAATTVLSVSPGDAGASALLKRLNAMPQKAPARREPPARETLRRCEKGRRLADRHDYRAAVVELEMAAWLDEAAALPHHYLANVHYLQGHLAEAVRHEAMAVERAPGVALYRKNLSALRAALKTAAEKPAQGGTLTGRKGVPPAGEVVRRTPGVELHRRNLEALRAATEH